MTKARWRLRPMGSGHDLVVGHHVLVAVDFSKEDGWVASLFGLEESRADDVVYHRRKLRSKGIEAAKREACRLLRSMACKRARGLFRMAAQCRGVGS